MWPQPASLEPLGWRVLGRRRRDRRWQRPELRLERLQAVLPVLLLDGQRRDGQPQACEQRGWRLVRPLERHRQQTDRRLRVRSVRSQVGQRRRLEQRRLPQRQVPQLHRPRTDRPRRGWLE